MIFVSVGTPNRPFNRLIQAVDAIADKVDEKILAQIGCSTYIPEKIDYFRFCKSDEMMSYIERASIIISQAGFGIIGNAIKLSKPMIIVPREMKYGEAIDRQYELAEHLASQNESIICLRDVSLLVKAIDDLKHVRVQYKYESIVPELIDEYIARNIFQEN